jgi:hypothetical protein
MKWKRSKQINGAGKTLYFAQLPDGTKLRRAGTKGDVWIETEPGRWRLWTHQQSAGERRSGFASHDLHAYPDGTSRWVTHELRDRDIRATGVIPDLSDDRAAQEWKNYIPGKGPVIRNRDELRAYMNEYGFQHKEPGHRQPKFSERRERRRAELREKRAAIMQQRRMR